MTSIIRVKETEKYPVGSTLSIVEPDPRRWRIFLWWLFSFSKTKPSVEVKYKVLDRTQTTLTIKRTN